MPRTISFGLTLSLALGLAALGCSGRSAPTDPAGQGNAPEPAVGSFPLAMAELVLDYDTGQVELIPLRLPAAVGDAYTLDASQFLTRTPCTDCMVVKGYGRDAESGGLRVDVQIRHPYPEMDVRADLDAFDPKVVVVTHEDPLLGSLAWPNTPGADTDNDGSPEPLSGNRNVLLNADGYTTHFDKRVEELTTNSFDGNLNPYKTYYDDPLNVNRRWAQAAAPETKSLIFAPLPSGRLQTFLVLEVSWGVSTTKATRLLPQYYIPWFNQKEAWSVEADDIFKSLTSVVDSTSTIRVSAADWQSPAEINVSYPNPGRPDYIPTASTVVQVMVECPGISTSVFSSATTLRGIGTINQPLEFEIPIINHLAAPAGSYPALVTVQDSLDGQTQTPIGTSPPLGFLNDVRAYRIIDLTVQDPLNFKVATGVSNLVLPGSQHSIPGQSEDIAVYGGGVLIPSADGATINHYSPDYLAGPTAYAAGRLPFDDYPGNPHPSPAATMPVKHIDAADDGSFILTFDDDNFTFNPAGIPGSTLTRALPNSDFAAYTDNDSGLLFPAPRFIGGCGSDCLDAPVCSLVAFGEKMRNVWDDPSQFDIPDALGYVAGGENTERCNSTINWFVFGAPYQSAADKQVSGNANLLFDVPPASFFANFKAADAGTVAPDGKQMLYALVGDSIYAVDQREGFVATTRVASPTVLDKRIIMDPINDLGYEAIDIQVLEYDEDVPRNLNGAGQLNDWIVVLIRDNNVAGEGIIRVYDASTLALIQQIDGTPAGDGTLAFYVTAMDVSDVAYDIHVAMDDNGPAAGGNYVVTVYSLLP